MTVMDAIVAPDTKKTLTLVNYRFAQIPIRVVCCQTTASANHGKQPTLHCHWWMILHCH